MNKVAFAFGFILLLLCGCANLPASNTQTASTVPTRQEQPSILIILLDDLGYSDIGAFGSEIRTPNIDSLAARGATFSQFYVYPRCSPTRAALMTGRYPHEAGLAFLTTPEGSNPPAGPYQGYLEPSLPTLPGLLRNAGYKTYMSGKWHLGEAPENWPRNRGFDRYFGLISGASSYYELLENSMTERRMALDDNPFTPPETGFFMTDATTDYAQVFLKEHREASPDRPFFLYLAYTAPHWPLHAPEADIHAYDGVYDNGWNSIRAARYAAMKKRGILRNGAALPAPPQAVGNWDEYQDKADWARKMQVHAAMVTRADAGIGRVVNGLRKSGQFDNTIIMVFSDNGASSEDVKARRLHIPGAKIGARGSYVSYEKQGAFTSNTPLRDYKGSTHEGAVRSPLIISWPKGLASTQYDTHSEMVTILDVMPTILTAAGVDISSVSLSGRDLKSALTGGEKPAAKPFFWDHVGWRGIRDGKWKAVSSPGSKSWTLYNLEEDPVEAVDLAAKYPERITAMQSDWQLWADRVGVKPMSMQALMKIFFPKAQ